MVCKVVLIFSEWYVKCTSSLGSAVAGSDYTVVSSPLTFPATTSTDDSMQCISINITDDLVFEESETFTVTVTTTNGGVTLGNGDATVNITDNEGQYSDNACLSERRTSHV